MENFLSNFIEINKLCNRTIEIKQNFKIYKQMNEFGISKIMDGIFISDLSLIYVHFTLIKDH